MKTALESQFQLRHVSVDERLRELQELLDYCGAKRRQWGRQFELMAPEDVCQDVIMGVYSGDMLWDPFYLKHGLVPGSTEALMLYMRGAVRKKLRNRFEEFHGSSRREALPEDADRMMDLAQLDMRFRNGSPIERARRALKRLNKQEYLPVLEKIIEGRTQEDAAEQLGKTREQYRYALRKLAALLAPFEVALRSIMP
jgi:hypothetical protein